MADDISFQRFTNLKNLQVTKFSIACSNINQLSGLTKLIAWGKPSFSEDNPPQFAEVTFPHLKRLECTDLLEFPRWILKLTNLTRLKCFQLQASDGHKDITCLQNLTELALTTQNHLAELPRLGEFSFLKKLELISGLAQIQSDADILQLTQLSKLIRGIILWFPFHPILQNFIV